jgi:hypothetical protein
LGYDDIKVSGLFPPPAEIEFSIPVGIFVQGKKKYYSILRTTMEQAQEKTLLSIFI